MARINIDDKWFSDPRREALGFRIGILQADGVALRVWRIGFEYYKAGESLVPETLFNTIPHASDFIAVGLAEKTERGIYIKGSKNLFGWYLDMVEQRRNAGKKRAEGARDEAGKFLPNSPQIPREKPKPSVRSRKTPKTLEKGSSDYPAGAGQNDQKHPATASENQLYYNYNYNNTNTENLKSNDFRATSVAAIDPILESKTQVAIPEKPGQLPGEVVKHSGKELGSSPNTNNQVFIGTYVKAFQTRYGPKTRPALLGKTTGQIKNFLAAYPLERACNLIQAYLQMDEPWFKTKCHDFSTFLENLNKISIAFDTGHDISSSKIDWSQVNLGESL